jgi:transcriptional regulator with XRE-family HTH domain
MEEIPQQTPGVHAGEQGATMNLGYATKPERVFAANFREARKARGVTQKNVADAMNLLGFSMMHTTIAKIEGGQRPISLNEAFCLAACIQTNILHLLGLDELAQQAQIIKASQATNELQGKQAQILDFVQKEERKHRQALRNYLSDRLAELGPEEE